MKNIWTILSLGLIGLLLIACKTKVKKDPLKDTTPQSGTIYISVDETFKPVMEQEIKVYQNTFPQAHIVASYKSEAECFKDLDKDSVTMVITARRLTEKENKYYEGQLSYVPPSEIMAWDAIPIVVNNASKDSLFSKEDLKKYLSSNNAADPQVIVDGSNATSTVRYLMDSVLQGKNFGTNVVAANGSKDVLDYISHHDHAIGFVGSSWIGSDKSNEQIAYLKFLKLAMVKCGVCKQLTYAKPSQETIANLQYPLYRPLVAIVKDNTFGLPKGFFNFMMADRGQLIFSSALLVPGKINLTVRTMLVK